MSKGNCIFEWKLKPSLTKQIVRPLPPVNPFKEKRCVKAKGLRAIFR